MRTLKVSLRRNNSTVAVFDYEDDKKLVLDAEVVGLKSGVLVGGSEKPAGTKPVK